MTEEPKQPKPKTLDELEKELDADELKPEIVSVESMVDGDAPDPRGAGSVTDSEPVRVSDDDLRAAGEAAETAADTAEDHHFLDLKTHPHGKPHFWKRKKFWFIFIAVVVVALLLAWFILPSRLFIVNTLGLRSTVTVTTSTLEEDGQPTALIQNVTVECNGAPTQTNDVGQTTCSQPYGEVQIVAKKSGYEQATSTVLLDFDPFFYLLGGRQQDEELRHQSLKLKAVGNALVFEARDWLTDKPLTTGAFTAGEMVATPNDQGMVSLRIPASDSTSVMVKSVLGGAYVDKDFRVELDSRDVVTFVPTGKNYFVTKSAGAATVSSSDLDGSSSAVELQTTSSETAAMNFTISPNGKTGVLASTRANARDDQNALLQRLYVVDMATKKLTQVDEALTFRFVDWSGETLVYVAGERVVKATETTQRLASLDTTAVSRKDLATATYFSQVRVAIGSVVYVKGFAANETGYDASPELRIIPVKGGTEKTIGTQVSQITQPDFDRFVFQTGDGAWHEYNVNTNKVINTAAPASNYRAFLATTSIDGQNRLFVDRVDGVPTIFVKSVANGQEHKVFGAAAIQGPIRWVGNTIVFRQLVNGQMADYAVSMTGTAPKKITDVIQPTSVFAPPTNYIAFF